MRKPATQRWDKMGIELEGAWNTDYRALAATVTGAHASTDGSVRDLPGQMGEIKTRPHTILEHLQKDVRTLYPHTVNNSCGLHMHLSFKTVLDYSTLADKPFWDFFRERWAVWGKANEGRMGNMKTVFWARLEGRWKGGTRGDRNYCKAEFDPVKQLNDHNQEGRYTILNFCAYHKFKTLEVRHLPMFHDVELSCEAAAEMAAVFDDYLNDHAYPKLTLYKEWKDLDGLLVDETVLPTPDIAPITEERISPHQFVAPEGDDVTYAIEGAMELMLPWANNINGNNP